jgi:hypothetical protein
LVGAFECSNLPPCIVQFWTQLDQQDGSSSCNRRYSLCSAWGHDQLWETDNPENVRNACCLQNGWRSCNLKKTKRHTQVSFWVPRKTRLPFNLSWILLGKTASPSVASRRHLLLSGPGSMTHWYQMTLPEPFHGQYGANIRVANHWWNCWQLSVETCWNRSKIARYGSSTQWRTIYSVTFWDHPRLESPLWPRDPDSIGFLRCKASRVLLSHLKFIETKKHLYTGSKKNFGPHTSMALCLSFIQQWILFWCEILRAIRNKSHGHKRIKLDTNLDRFESYCIVIVEIEILLAADSCPNWVRSPLFLIFTPGMVRW